MRPQGSAEQLEQRRRWAVRLLEEGLDPPEVAQILGATVRSVQRWDAATRDGNEASEPGGRATRGSAAQALAGAGPASHVVAAAQRGRLRLRHRTLERAARRPPHRRHLRRQHESPVPQRLAPSPREHHAAGPAAASGRAGRRGDRAVEGMALAAHQKKVRELRATLAFSDEGGFLLLPLIRTTLAPRGRTPPRWSIAPGTGTRSRPPPRR